MNQLKVSIPLYVQIAEGLLEQIESAELVPGDRLPSERKLSKQLGVTRTTLRQALNLLETQGLLKRMHGVGTYVANMKIDRHANQLVPFTKGIRRRGHAPGAKVVMMRQELASVSIARKLNLKTSAPIFYSHRLRMVNHEPTMLEKFKVPIHIFPDFHEQDLDNQSVYEVMERVYNVAITHADLSIEAVSATEYEAELLGVPKGAPLMLEERVGYDKNGRPVEYAKDLYRGDRFRFVTRKAGRIDSIMSESKIDF